MSLGKALSCLEKQIRHLNAGWWGRSYRNDRPTPENFPRTSRRASLRISWFLWRDTTFIANLHRSMQSSSYTSHRWEAALSNQRVPVRR